MSHKQTPRYGTRQHGFQPTRVASETLSYTDPDRARHLKLIVNNNALKNPKQKNSISRAFGAVAVMAAGVLGVATLGSHHEATKVHAESNPYAGAHYLPEVLVLNSGVHLRSSPHINNGDPSDGDFETNIAYTVGDNEAFIVKDPVEIDSHFLSFTGTDGLQVFLSQDALSQGRPISGEPFIKIFPAPDTNTSRSVDFSGGQFLTFSPKGITESVGVSVKVAPEMVQSQLASMGIAG